MLSADLSPGTNKLFQDGVRLLPNGARVTMLAEWCGDAVSDFLSALRVQRTFWGRIELTAPAGVRFSAIPSVRCHLVIKGGTFLKVANAATPISLQRGDFVLLPRGSDFTLQDAPGSPIYFGDPARDIAIRLGRIPLIQWGGGGESTILMFGRFELDTIAAKFLQTLPDVIHIPSEDGALPHWAGPLCSADALLRSTSGPGAETVMCRFAEMCIAAGVRNFLASTAAAEQRLTFGAPKLNRVVRRIHENPGQRWSVSCLAQEAGMSRAAFALAFREVFGEPPMHYLTGVRMARASEMLRNKALSLQDVSFQLGYESEVSFSRAFKRHWAISPGACRRKHQGHV